MPVLLPMPGLQAPGVRMAWHCQASMHAAQQEEVVVR